MNEVLISLVVINCSTGNLLIMIHRMKWGNLLVYGFKSCLPMQPMPLYKCTHPVSLNWLQEFLIYLVQMFILIDKIEQPVRIY